MKNKSIINKNMMDLFGNMMDLFSTMIDVFLNISFITNKRIQKQLFMDCFSYYNSKYGSNLL